MNNRKSKFFTMSVQDDGGGGEEDIDSAGRRGREKGNM
jgi:hypothetical protein